jgi:hypothetical protein
VPYVSPAQWSAKSGVLDRWCERVGRDPRAIARTVNVGFYLGADAAGRERAERLYQSEWGADKRGFTGFLRGSSSEAAALVAAYRDAGVERLNIAVRAGPYDWDALGAFADDVMPQFR